MGLVVDEEYCVKNNGTSCFYQLFELDALNVMWDAGSSLYSKKEPQGHLGIIIFMCMQTITNTRALCMHTLAHRQCRGFSNVVSSYFFMKLIKNVIFSKIDKV